LKQNYFVGTNYSKKNTIAAKINFFSVDSDLNLKNEKMFLLEQIVPLDKNEKIFY